MKVAIRKTNVDDLPFYRLCFSNEEFYYMIYNYEPFNIEKYVFDDGVNLRYVCAVQNENGLFRDVGFAHFYYVDDCTYCFVGGIRPDLFNSGIGVLSSLAVISYLFDIKPDVCVTSGVFKHNPRSKKMLDALGFVRTKEDEEKILLKLTGKDFHNDFVERLMMDIEYDFIG